MCVYPLQEVGVAVPEGGGGYCGGEGSPGCSGGVAPGREGDSGQSSLPLTPLPPPPPPQSGSGEGVC